MVSQPLCRCCLIITRLAYSDRMGIGQAQICKQRKGLYNHGNRYQKLAKPAKTEWS